MGKFGGINRARIVRGNCRTRDEGPSDLFTDVWQEIWNNDLEKEHKGNSTVNRSKRV